jgi:hypothetical protein
VEINLADPFCIETKFWTKVWECSSSTLTRVFIHVTGFDEPQILVLAEIAYFFAESNEINRIHKNRLALTEDRDITLDRGTLLDGTEDDRPTEHILVDVVAGHRNDKTLTMFGLVAKMIEIGRANRLESRETVRMLVFDWIIGSADNTTSQEQRLGRRSVDIAKYQLGISAT